MTKDLAFVGGTDEKNNQVAVVENEDGPSIDLAGEVYPLMDVIFHAQIVQPGHLKNAESKGLFKGHVGEFYLTEMEEFYPELRLLPIVVTSRMRRMWGEFSTDDTELLCYSADGENPALSVTAPYAEKCGTYIDIGGTPSFKPECPKAKWVNGQKPECAEVMKVGFLDIDNLLPLEIQFKGTQISAWNKFKKSYKLKKNVARRKGESINDYVIRMSLENEGTYVSLNMDFVYAKDDNPSKYIPMAQWYYENLFQPAMEAQRLKQEQMAKEAMGEATDVDYEVDTPDNENPDEANTAEENVEEFDI